MVWGFHCDALADLAEAEDQALFGAVIDVFLEVEDVIGCEEVAAIGAFYDAGRGCGRTGGSGASHEGLSGSSGSLLWAGRMRWVSMERRKCLLSF